MHVQYQKPYPCPAPRCARVEDDEDDLQEHIDACHRPAPTVSRATQRSITVPPVNGGDAAKPDSTAQPANRLAEGAPQSIRDDSIRLQRDSLSATNQPARQLGPEKGDRNVDQNTTTNDVPGPSRQVILEITADDRIRGVTGDGELSGVRAATHGQGTNDLLPSNSGSTNAKLGSTRDPKASITYELENDTASAEQVVRLDLISATFCAHELQLINLAALSDIDIGPYRFRRGVQGLVEMFGQGLQSETQSQLGKLAAAALQGEQNSIYVAQLIERQTRGIFQAQRTKSSPPISVDPGGGAVNAGEDERADVPGPLSALELESLFSGGDAYGSYKKKLLAFAHNPYEKRISRAFGLASKVIDGSGKVLNRRGVTLVAQEISWTPIALLTWSCNTSLPILDQFKGFVESVMGETWNWWPPNPRLRRIDNGFCRLSWQTVRLFSRSMLTFQF